MSEAKIWWRMMINDLEWLKKEKKKVFLQNQSMSVYVYRLTHSSCLTVLASGTRYTSEPSANLIGGCAGLSVPVATSHTYLGLVAVILNSADFDHYLHRAFNWTALLVGERGRVGVKKRFLQQEKWCGQTECYSCSLNTGHGGIINNVLSIILAVWSDRDGCPQGTQLSGYCVPSPRHWVSLEGPGVSEANHLGLLWLERNACQQEAGHPKCQD